MEIAERIQQLIETLGMNATTFAERVGVERSGLSHIFKGRNKPGLDLIMRIVEEFPEVTTDWLLWGKTEPEPKIINTISGITNVTSSHRDKRDRGNHMKSEDCIDLNIDSDRCNIEVEASESIPVCNSPSREVIPEVMQTSHDKPDDKVAAPAVVHGISKVILLHDNGTFSVYEPGVAAE